MLSGSSRGSLAAAVVVALGLAVMAAFQLFWALGGTWALDEASGGSLESTIGTRIASGVLGLVLVAAALLVLARVGLWHAPVSDRLVRGGTWAVAIALLLGALVNFLGSTNWERFAFAPPALVLGVLAVFVARSESTPTPARHGRTPSAAAPA